MAITIKEMRVQASVTRTVKEVTLSPEAIRQIKDDILHEIKEELQSQHPSRKER